MPLVAGPGLGSFPEVGQVLEGEDGDGAPLLVAEHVRTGPNKHV